MEKKEILQKVIDYYTDGNKSQFAAMIGVPAQNVSAWLRRNSFDVDIISTKCININPTFLLTGEGPITLDTGVTTPPASHTATTQPLNNANFDHRINELLAISSNLYEMFRAVNDRLAEATAIITKSQQQFDRVLDLYDKQNKHGHTSYMVAED